MKLYKFGILLVLIFLFTIGAVSSQDVNQTDELTVDSSDEIEIISTSENTFTDLNNDMSNGNVINLTKEYTYDKNTDKNYANGVPITKNLTINGNNHVIDGSGQSRIFTIHSGNVIINNLIIKNANNSAIFIKNATLTTNNVTFENNVGGEEGGAIHAEKVNYTSVNDKFINNFAIMYGAAIFINDNSTLIINNDTFKSDKHLNWGLIEIRESKMTVTNTNFSNMTSQYTNAIHAEETEGIIKNCNFDNLYANITAGALAIKGIYEEIIIDNCTFKNVSSKKNAGAVFSDISSGDLVDYDGSCTISNSQFIKCSSEFGGAFIQLGGTLKISNSIFRDNNAYYDGGAVYLSYVESNFENLVFINNKADQSNNSGAIFSHFGNLKITKTNFTDNKGSIYIYGSNYNILNSNFKGNQANIYSFFDGKTAVLKNNYYADGNNKLNQIDYVYTYEIKNIPIDYNPISLDLSLINASSFDLRDYGLVSPVKNQGRMGSCWSFATSSALESALLKATNGTLSIDISENYARNLGLLYYIHGGIGEEGGDGEMGAVYFVSMGGLEEKYDNHDELGKISSEFKDIAKYYPYEAIFIECRQDIYDNYKIKEALVKYGALAVSVLSTESVPNDYNDITYAAFSNVTTDSDHAVTLVGWDDNYSASNFKITPPGNGAWIVKNSWDTDWGENGYYYVSYYDDSALRDDPLVGFVFAPEIPYNKIYQYDTGGEINFARELSRELTPEEIKLPRNEMEKLLDNLTIPSNFTNTFVADGNDIISAIGTYFEKSNIDYTIKISVKGKEVYTQNGKSTHGGSEIIKLDKQINVNKGETFSVNLIAKKSPTISSKNKIPANASIQYTMGKIVDTTSDVVIAAIKVYTNPNINTEGLNKYYGADTPLTVKVNPGDDVTFEINGITATVKADENGIAKLGINLDSGSYDLAITYNGTTILYSVVINTTIISKDVTRGYNSNYNYKIKLLNSTGDALNNVRVNLTLNNKQKEFTTDEEGFITVNFSKLTSTQTLEITNPETGEKTKNTIKVVSRFKGNSNIKMYYFDGTSYKFKVYGDDGKLVGAKQTITVKLNKKTYKIKTNAKGIAKLKIPKTVKPGTYKITATYKGQTVKNTVKVKQVLKTSKKTVKKSAKRLVLKASLKNSKAIKGKKVTFKFNGKNYKAKTNSKGIAKVTIKKNVIQKLKKGKTYTVKVTYLKDTVKTTVKVKG